MKAKIEICMAAIAFSKLCTNFTSPKPSYTSHNFPKLIRSHKASSSAGPGDEPRTALNTVLKLYRAIETKNVLEVSDVIAEECLCVSNLVSSFGTFWGKEQVVEFFCCVMKRLGNNVQLVVQETSDDGMVVGVSWKLEWNSIPLPLGQGLGVYMCHVYEGKVMIKRAEIFLEALLHIQPLRLKLISLVMTAIGKLDPRQLLKNQKQRTRIVLLILLFAVVAMSFIF